MKKWMTLFGITFIQAAAYAAEELASSALSGQKGLFAIAAAVSIAVAAVGGALGQGKIAASAMEGLSRNPQAQKNMFTSMILGLAFIESVMIYALVIAILILGKI